MQKSPVLSDLSLQQTSLQHTIPSAANIELKMSSTPSSRNIPQPTRNPIPPSKFTARHSARKRRSFEPPAASKLIMVSPDSSTTRSPRRTTSLEADVKTILKDFAKQQSRLTAETERRGSVQAAVSDMMLLVARRQNDLLEAKDRQPQTLSQRTIVGQRPLSVFAKQRRAAIDPSEARMPMRFPVKASKVAISPNPDENLQRLRAEYATKHARLDELINEYEKKIQHKSSEKMNKHEMRQLRWEARIQSERAAELEAELEVQRLRAERLQESFERVKREVDRLRDAGRGKRVVALPIHL